MPHQPWEIPYEELTFSEFLGKGSSGSVFLGTWHNEPVAIKKLICNTSLQEAQVLRYKNFKYFYSSFLFISSIINYHFDFSFFLSFN